MNILKLLLWDIVSLLVDFAFAKRYRRIISNGMVVYFNGDSFYEYDGQTMTCRTVK